MEGFVQRLQEAFKLQLSEPASLDNRRQSECLTEGLPLNKIFSEKMYYIYLHGRSRPPLFVHHVHIVELNSELPLDKYLHKFKWPFYAQIPEVTLRKSSLSRSVTHRYTNLLFLLLTVTLPIKMRRSSRAGPSQSQGPAQSQRTLTQRPRNGRNQMDLVSEEEEEERPMDEDEGDEDDVQVEGTNVSFEFCSVFFSLSGSLSDLGDQSESQRSRSPCTVHRT
jgi:hypothetical protein